jgi:serine/threonine-protein kinase
MSVEEDERYQRAQAIVHELLELDPPLRAARMQRACADDDALRREVEWLLEAVDDDSGAGTLKPAIDALARVLLADARVEAVAPRRYRLVERLGEGGMGQVWLAERDDGTTRQRVALKMLRAGAPGERELARFLAEGRILAGLNHPNIAHLVDAGRGADGAPFLAMEYVEGERIDRWCDARRAGLRERIELFLKVCAAVEYAHARLVIHRDLKPANILVGAGGEPKLLDFGIARLLDDAPGANATTVVRAMTLAYASPEQIEGKPLGTATDIYSLGIVLYEVLAGTRPFAHVESEHARTSAILSGDVEAPSRVARRAAVGRDARLRRIPVDVDAIVLKALRREAERRYASVAELADDLRNYLAARPVLARRDAFGYRTRRFLWRNRWPLAAAVLVAALAGGFTWRTVLAERDARLAADVAGKTTDFLVSTFALSDPTSAGRHDFTAREVLDQGRARIETELAGQPRARARLLEALGNAYRGINEGNAGAPLLEEAARLALTPAVDEPLAAARSLRAKALAILGARGSSDEAEQAARRALDLVLRHGAGDLRLLADAYGTLAQALDAAGKAPQAMASARRALELREASHAAPPEIAQSLLDICTVTSDVGEHAAAVPYCERALALHASAGSTHTNAYRLALREYENALLYAGDYAKALATRRDRLALTRELFGEDSAVLAMDRVVFAVTLAEHGLFDEAAGSLAAGLPVIERRNGRQSTQYALAIFDAGWIKYLLGEFDAAVPLLREALRIYEAAVGSKDNDRLPVLRVDLAIALIDAGHAGAEARALLESVIEARSAAQPDTSELAYARLPLARWHVAHREYAQAESLLDQVEAVGTRVEPELHARAAATRATILRARGDDAGALAHDRRAYELNLRDVGAGHPRTAYFALAYARALRAAGNAREAESLERDARPILEQAYPADSAYRRVGRN